METTDNDELIPNLPDEKEYPRELTAAYELLECLSEKENTRTLLAVDRENGERRVVKCFLRANALYAHSEPETLRSLDIAPMPCFVAEYVNEEMRCVLREYIPGVTLAQLASEKAFSEEEVIEIGAQLCGQLSVLHGMDPPVIHRDLKPQNVIIRPDGTAVLIDFGIARVHTENETDTVAFGTQGFAPPEQYGFSQTDARSDIYSLGVLLYWLLHRKTRISCADPTALEKVILRCTHFDPENRYADVERLRRALLAAKPAEQRKRKRTVLLAAVLALAALIAAGCLAFRAYQRPVSFSQPLLEQAVRANLKLSEGQKITAGMLDDVTAVYIVADRVCPDADSFYLAIEQWYAGGKTTRGPITELTDLSMLANLKRVCIAAQELSDVSALAGHTQLELVEFKHNYITDISVLSGMNHLYAVGINDNPVRDISPLVDCPNLAFLDLCDVRSYDPSVLAQLGNFDFLDISNPTESYRCLDGKSILDLRIAWTGLEDLHVLDRVTRLERLEIDHTLVDDLSPLSLHKGIKTLRLTGTPVRELSVLLELPQLKEVRVGEEMRSAVEALGEIPFAVIYE